MRVINILYAKSRLSFKTLRGCGHIIKKAGMNFILVAYYTLGSIYEKPAKALMDAAEELGVECVIKVIPDLGGWCQNTDFKPTLVKDVMLEFPDKNIVYTDADSMLHRYPVIFDCPDADVIVRKQDFPWRKNEFLSGTFFMRNNEQCRSLVDSWINKVKSGKTVRTQPETWEQYHLGRALEESGIKYAQLPHEYIYFDHIAKAEGKVENPVFTHMQYSRKTANR